MIIDHKVRSEIQLTSRVKQLGAMFDVPLKSSVEHCWSGELDFDARPWSIGLIVGPSGCGKSTLMRKIFGEETKTQWIAKSVIDDFASNLSMKDITAACSAVGFNTIPSWMKPYHVLSTGEKFRVHLARVLLESGDLAVVDEFTSVVDRQVAKIASHALQKYVRRRIANGGQQKFVAVGCHHDVIDWLQPDWVLEPESMKLTWRSVQPRPELKVKLARLDHASWKTFGRFHYMSADLHKAARCFGLTVNGRPVCFAGLLWQPLKVARAKPIVRVSRLVTLPDWQGVGLAFSLIDRLGAAYKAIGVRFRCYPAHPSFVRSYDRSSTWALIKRPGKYLTQGRGLFGKQGGRPCAVFEYAGDAMSLRDARRILQGSDFGLLREVRG